MDAVERLSQATEWSFSITNLEDDAVLNIYAVEDQWPVLRKQLGLERLPAETGDDYQTWYNGSLALSLILPEEEEDGPESGDECRF